MDKSTARIVKKGSQWCVVSEDGSKNLGCSNTKEGAVQRLREVEYYKHHSKSEGNEMNYEQAFRNMAKSLTGKEINPADIGKASDTRPNIVRVPSETITEGFSSGSIAGQPSRRLLDKKDHFPVFTENQARSSLSRAMQLTDVPIWYSGNLNDLRKEVFAGIAKAHPELAPSLNVSVPASKIVALSDGQTTEETSVKDIDNPADVTKTQVPQVKRPTLSSAEFIKACKDDQVRIVLAGKLLDCIEQQEEDLSTAKDMASRLLKEGISAEEFDVLSTYLQSDILREMLYNEANVASASIEDRRRELINRLNKKD